MRSKAVLVPLIFIVIACSTPSTVAPVSFPLQYKMVATAAEFPTLSSCAGVSKVEVEDARDSKTLGKRSIEGNATASADVTTTTSVTDWVRTGFEQALTRSGAATNKAGGPTLHVRIEQIRTIENVLHRAGYEGHLGLSAQLVPARGGAACWKGSADSQGENYGYPGSAENYNETLNHALDRAIIKLIGASDFKTAACDCT